MAARPLVVGGGLAGCEAALALARAGLDVELREMRPTRPSPAHETTLLGELVCSNSLRGAELTHAVGLLKEEMRRLGSAVMEAADATRVPAGRALAVDRARFAALLTERVEGDPRIEVVRAEVTELPEERPTLVATGPLTSEALAAEVARLTGSEGLRYYDAIAPVVATEGLDMERLFAGSRYEEGEDYLNVPLDEAAYLRLVEDLLAAEKVEPHPFEEPRYFEGCLPVEVLASRGTLTLAHGPLKPVGLRDPRTGRRPFAALQLRREDEAGTAWNLVGFQTRMTQPEQRRVLRSLPGLEEARFLRYGSVHRNTYVEAPRVLGPRLELRARPTVLLAGQLTGVEGYVESAASGLLAGLFMAAGLLGLELPPPPRTTAHGGLLAHLAGAGPSPFAPSNMTWALLPAPPRVKGRNTAGGRNAAGGRAERRRAAAERALSDLDTWRGAGPPQLLGPARR